jgi:hypothetical protein
LFNCGRGAPTAAEEIKDGEFSNIQKINAHDHEENNCFVTENVLNFFRDTIALKSA